MSRPTIHIVALLFLLDLAALGQGLNTNYNFRHYTTEDGLSNNWAFTVLEDDMGFIWIGTRDGLNRFDGYEFKTYDVENSILEDSYITALQKGQQNKIWVGTSSAGLYQFSWESGEFISIKSSNRNPASLSSNKIACLTESKDGVLWIGTNGGGLNSIENDSLEVKRYDLGTACLRIRSLEIDHDDNIWIGTLEGLFHFDRKTLVVSKIEHDSSEGSRSSNNRILSLHIDIVGRLWVGTDGSGIFYLDQHSRKLKTLDIEATELSEITIRKITSFPDGRIALGTNTSGVVLLDPVTNEIQSISSDPDNINSLVNNSVYDVMFDRFGSLWVTSFSEGVNYYNKYDKKFTTISHIQYKPNNLSNSNVRCFYQDSQERIWIGTRAGLNLRVNNESEYKTYNLRTKADDPASSPIVLSMLEDSKGKFWVGTYAEGIRLLNRENGKVVHFQHPDDENNSLLNAHIYGLLEDSGNNIWMASMGGAYLLDSKGELRRYTIQNSNICSNQVRVLLEDSKNNIWLGTAQGLNCYKPDSETFESYLSSSGSNNEIRNNHIFCLFENDDGKIWVGTEGGGIKIIDLNDASIHAIDKSDGLPGNTINAIEKDQTGKFWISTNNGLCKYDHVTKQVVVFSREDGLQSNEFYPNSSLLTTSGELYFGGYNGMNHFDPSSILINPYIPGIRFTSLFLKNQEVSVVSEGSPLSGPLAVMDKLNLNYKQNTISIHFAGVGFINPEKYKYSYYLEGFEDNWSPFSKNRVANYSNLDQGSYTLKVRVMNNDHQIGEDIAELSISVSPPPWSTWWAYMIYVSIVVALLFLFRSYVLSWAKVKNELELEKREKNQNEELNQMKLRFFTNISHEFRTPLTLLRGYIDKLAPGIKDKAGSNSLEQINRNSSRMLNLVDELMDFRKADSGLLKLKASKGDLVKYTKEIKEEFDELAEQQNIDYTFESEFPAYEVWFDPGKIEKILFNLISNAFKFTASGGAITIAVSVNPLKPVTNIKRIQSLLYSDEGWIEISVSDTGIGISEKDVVNIFDRFFQVSDEVDDVNHQKGTGIGLAFSKRLVDIHKGKMELHSKLNKGSKFTIRLPLGKDYLNEDEIFITDKERFYLRLNYRSKITETFGLDQQLDPESAYAPGKALVLIIEDNLQVINLLKDSLSEPFNVIYAIDGKSGLEMVAEQNPDIIVTDLMMPGMTGIEVCNHLKCDPVTSHIPIVILTAKTDESTQVEGLKIGADAFLPKPFSAQILTATIENILANRIHLKEKFAAMDIIAPSDLTRNKIDESFLQRAISFIEDNLQDPSLDVTLLCSELGMSRSVLYRKIKALTGHSIQDFIRGVRLRKAKHYLTNTDKSVSEVSYLVGFSNTKHFSTSFKKEFLLSPSEFRK